MAWYHIYQHAEIKHPDYPKLRGRALPIIQYEICEHRVLGVNVQLKDGQSHWFYRPHIMLYKSGKSFLDNLESAVSESLIRKFLRRFNLRRG